jgi:hypothetical protein
LASSLTVQDAVTFCSTLIKNQRLDVNNLQPGLGMGNIVLQRMLGSPFIWRFNRATFSIAITEGGGTDYTQTLPLLGRIEKQWLVDATEAANIYELNGAQALAVVSSIRRPTHVAPVYDDNLGDLVFRFNSIPDQDYTANFDYQQKAPLISSYGQTFGPVPDEFAYLFLKGFLAEAGLLVNDSRFPLWQRDFAYGLLATQDGLDEQARNMFLEGFLNVGRTATRSQMAGQTGGQGRAV